MIFLHRGRLYNAPSPRESALSALRSVTSANQLFALSCPEELKHPVNDRILLSSYAGWDEDHDRIFEKDTVYPSTSLSHAIINAYATHQDLILRPDEVWLEVLNQLSLYTLDNNQVSLELFAYRENPIWSIQASDLSADNLPGAIDGGFTYRLRKQPTWLKEWMMPDFSTTTPADKTIAQIVLTGRPNVKIQPRGQDEKCYTFDPKDLDEQSKCGLPSVSLLGSREDWQVLRDKLDYLLEKEIWGEDVHTYAKGLEGIFKRFVDTWDKPNSAEVKEFWSKMVVPRLGLDCDVDHEQFLITGWLTGFYFNDGRGIIKAEETGVKLGDFTHKTLGLYDLPVGYGTLFVNVYNFPKKNYHRQIKLVAGNIGVYRTELGPGQVSAEPLSGWFGSGPHSQVVYTVPKVEGEKNMLNEKLLTCQYPDSDYTGVTN
ncbi:hypothetical protein HIM_08363 [Hirsutella minnesotensis 3608]|uniref:Uncharacterized protein n=1 Tax=Hirsutella minnesotensis 3608 TaxID=1043627 RepID=A0A0F7ZH89_9HYPO|nr:hypothetical protein HIM_08363 [Hirsutella minnesotensis 3608]